MRKFLSNAIWVLRNILGVFTLLIAVFSVMVVFSQAIEVIFSNYCVSPTAFDHLAFLINFLLKMLFVSSLAVLSIMLLDAN